MPPAVASPERAPGRPAPWWIRAFGSTYLTVYGHRDDAEARRNAPAIVALLRLRPHARVLDLACGEGRYARALAALGYTMTGIDTSEELLEQARRASPLLPGMPSYVRADMRSLPFGPQFDAVVSLFTSFGYFDDAEEDQRVLEGVARVLVPGGRFLLDFLNAAQVRSALASGAVEADDVRGPYQVRSRRRLDDTSPGGPFVRKEVVVTDTRTHSIVSEVEERVRLHDPAALDAMLERAGLTPVGAPVGDFDGSPATASSPRWIRVAERRGRR